MKKNSETEKLPNGFFHLKYHNSNKFQYFELKIELKTLKIWHFEEKNYCRIRSKKGIYFENRNEF